MASRVPRNPNGPACAEPANERQGAVEPSARLRATGCGPADASASAPAWRPPPRLRLRPGALKRFGPLLAIAGPWPGRVRHGLARRGHAREHRAAARAASTTCWPRITVLALATYSLSTSASTALSLPGGLVLTATGGLLFGWLARGDWRPWSAPSAGATLLFLVARSALGETFTARAGPWLAKLREGFQGRRAELPAVPAPGAGVSVLVRQYRAGHPGRAAQDLRCRHISSVSSPPPSPSRRQVRASTASSRRHMADHAQCVARKGAEACKLSIHARSLVTKELVLALVLLGIVALIPVAFRKWRSMHAAAK